MQEENIQISARIHQGQPKKVQDCRQNQNTPRKTKPRTPTIYLSLLSGVHLWLHNKFPHL